MSKKLAKQNQLGELTTDQRGKLNYFAKEVLKYHKQSDSAGRQMAGTIFEAHAFLVGANSEGAFKHWLDEIGLPRSTAYRAIAYLEDCELIGVSHLDTQIPQEGVRLLAKPETPVEVVAKVRRKDGQGQPVTVKEIRELIAEATPAGSIIDAEEDPVEALKSELESFARGITAMAKEAPHTEWLDEEKHQALTSQLKNAAATIRSCKPAGTCPACGGAGCPRCRSTGWMPKSVLDSH